MRRRSSPCGASGTRSRPRRTPARKRRRRSLMLGSLRVRLPLVFLAGIVLAGLITTLISVRLFQDFAHDQALTQLNREAHGIAGLYADAIQKSYGNSQDRAAPDFAARNL